MNNFQSINSLEKLENLIMTNTGVLLYFTTDSCSVGEALQPKIMDLIKTNFPKIKICNCDLNESPEIAANYQAFVEPTILVFFEGKETVRKSRNISMYELEMAIKRPYKLIFE